MPTFEEIKETLGFNSYYEEEKRYATSTGQVSWLRGELSYKFCYLVGFDRLLVWSLSSLVLLAFSWFCKASSVESNWFDLIGLLTWSLNLWPRT